ncbi:MAG: isochorismate synthase MenF [Burkholderiales bacterium]|jgi:menaquinone-specific isochorismate synthase|nr:isochorismate synthase MenF [Burkholderiales bacterium]
MTTPTLLLLNRLREQLASPFPDAPGTYCLSAQETISSPASLLNWLDAQILYPKFYWQHRADEIEAAVCGQIRSFYDADAVHDFLAHHTQIDTRVWGINAFDEVVIDQRPRTGFFFLPRFEIIRQGDLITMTCHLASEHSLRADARDATALLVRLARTEPLPALNTAITEIRHEPDYPQWRKMIEEALVAITARAFDKVVLARRTALTLTKPLSPAAFLATSRKVNHNCYHFMLMFAPHAAFLGSTPERLYRRDGLNLATEALAGTVANAEDDAQAERLADWLIADEKNQRENYLVVEDICQRLSDVAADLHIGAAHVLRLRKVQHLRRNINAHLFRANDAQCLQRLQPTAAVAGLPRAAARRFIAEHEPFTRGWYAGSAGYCAREEAEFAVTLRSALVEENNVFLYAGGGIVAGSEAESEWREIETKAAGLRCLLDDSNERSSARIDSEPLLQSSDSIFKK